MEFNRYLSQICEDYYSLAPRINHELLNIQNVQGQYLKARNDVVRAILDGKDLEEYEQGSSPQAMVYRAKHFFGQDLPEKISARFGIVERSWRRSKTFL